MEFTQKIGKSKSSFSFGQTQLDYMYAHDNYKFGSTIDYAKIPLHYSCKRRHGYWRIKYIALFFFCAGVFLAALGLRHGELNALYIFLIFTGLAIVLCLITRFTRYPMLTLFSADPNIAVLHDGQYEMIMAEITKRRAESSRRKYSEVNFLNNPAEEFEKFRRLRNDQLISEREFNDAVTKLLAAHRKPSNTVS